MIEKVSAAVFAAVLLGTMPALAFEVPHHRSRAEPAPTATHPSGIHDHVVAQAQKMESGHGSAGGMDSGMSHEKMMEKSAGGEAMKGQVMAHGVVNSVNKGDRTVNLSHEPISALGWPSMTMDMKVSDDVDLAKVPVGPPIDFTMGRGSDGIYVVKTITAQ